MGTAYRQVTAQGTPTSPHVLKGSVMLGALLEKIGFKNSLGAPMFKLKKSIKYGIGKMQRNAAPVFSSLTYGLRN